jgi:hypothetical protein
MTRPESNLSVPPGGRSSGSSLSLVVSFGSGSGGACAREAHAYITRSDECDDAERGAAVYTESDYMPAWA